MADNMRGLTYCPYNFAEGQNWNGDEHQIYKNRAVRESAGDYSRLYLTRQTDGWELYCGLLWWPHNNMEETEENIRLYDQPTTPLELPEVDWGGDSSSPIWEWEKEREISPNSITQTLQQSPQTQIMKIRDTSHITHFHDLWCRLLWFVSAT